MVLFCFLWWDSKIPPTSLEGFLPVPHEKSSSELLFFASRWVVAHHRCDCSRELSPPAASQQQRIDKFLIAPSNENPATAAFTPDVILSDLPVRTPAEQQQLQLMRRAHRSLKTLPRLLSFNVICAVNISSSLLTFSLPAGFKEMLLRKLSACQR